MKNFEKNICIAVMSIFSALLISVLITICFDYIISIFVGEYNKLTLGDQNIIDTILTSILVAVSQVVFIVSFFSLKNWFK